MFSGSKTRYYHPHQMRLPENAVSPRGQPERESGFEKACKQLVSGDSLHVKNMLGISRSNVHN